MAIDAALARPEGPTPDHNYSVTVVVDGVPKKHHLPAHMTVLEAVRTCLAPRDKPQAEDFTMVDRQIGTSPLEHSQTLEQAGVRDGHLLSITKRDGGGG
jgi:hypothetical protein